jgi:beta-galactosidase/beta-glucuronidase
MARIAKEMDPTRLVHYEGDFEAEVTDVYLTTKRELMDGFYPVESSVPSEKHKPFPILDRC